MTHKICIFIYRKNLKFIYYAREGEIIMFKYIKIVNTYLLNFITQLFKLFKNAMSCEEERYFLQEDRSLSVAVVPLEKNGI